MCDNKIGFISLKKKENARHETIILISTPIEKSRRVTMQMSWQNEQQRCFIMVKLFLCCKGLRRLAASRKGAKKFFGLTVKADNSSIEYLSNMCISQ